MPQKLFFGTGIPACILVLNRKKQNKRKNKILFIYGAKDYHEGKNRNTLRDEDITKMVSAFDKFEYIDRYCHVADLDEIKENEFNLNVPRYVALYFSQIKPVAEFPYLICICFPEFPVVFYFL